MRRTEPITGKRVVEYFAWLPVSINKFDGKQWHKETRWLEKVKIEQRRVEEEVSVIGEYFHGYWEDIKFIE
jgi:hypothetical protein